MVGFLSWLSDPVVWDLVLFTVIGSAVWAAVRVGAARAGRHLGVAGIGLVALLGAYVSWVLGYATLSVVVGIVGVVLIAAGLRGTSR